MSLNIIMSLLSAAMMLLTSASAPGVSSQLREQALAFSNQAIQSALTSLATIQTQPTTTQPTVIVTPSMPEVIPSPTPVVVVVNPPPVSNPPAQPLPEPTTSTPVMAEIPLREMWGVDGIEIQPYRVNPDAKELGTQAVFFHTNEPGYTLDPFFKRPIDLLPTDLIEVTIDGKTYSFPKKMSGYTISNTAVDITNLSPETTYNYTFKVTRDNRYAILTGQFTTLAD